MGVTERKLRQKEVTRASILQAARRIALREGWQAVTIRKIADEIEYTPPIVYEYFDNKDALLLAIVSEGFQAMRQEIMALRDKYHDPAERLMALSRHYWTFSFENPELYQLMFNLDRMHINRQVFTEELVMAKNIIVGTFDELSQGKTDVRDLIMNWNCLIHGYVTFGMFNQRNAPAECNHAHEKNGLPHAEMTALYENAIRRFIQSVSGASNLQTELNEQL